MDGENTWSIKTADEFEIGARSWSNALYLWVPAFAVGASVAMLLFFGTQVKHRQFNADLSLFGLTVLLLFAVPFAYVALFCAGRVTVRKQSADLPDLLPEN